MGGHSIALPTRFTDSQSKIAENKEGRGCGAKAERCPRRGQTKGPPPTGTAAPRRDPNPPLQPRTRGTDPLRGAVGGGGRQAAFGVILSFPPRHLPPRPSPARDAPDFSSS